ncbi:serine/threonine protein kinase [Mucisphaera calidilacus]|uniref:Serine/threonine-protein kinase PrkC n=1 Tax=Mucisphaera calidilacus TaxID=2527982 RepID=A0A518BUQ5_9BACT|nr:serine/threonine-protein kinase [Mucisphaera calidilacus]QDU70664.1 Serine/threonine-protein kinase PrkC [Mucisphaera calidilacus]
MGDWHEISGYQILGTLGKGAKSTIYEVRGQDGKRYALKHVIKDSPSDQRFIDQAVSEYELARKFDSPYLRKGIKLIRVRKVIRTSEVVVIMELIEGLPLEQYQPGNMLELIEIIAHSASGLHAMHNVGYVHADMKPNNIMVTPAREVKLIDFGQSCPVGTIKERIQGTPDYIAPEQVRRRAITPQTDVFNLGATIYWLLTKKHVPTLIPKERAGAGVSLKSVERCVPPAELNPKVPPALSSLVMDCVQHDMQDRPRSMAAVNDRLMIAQSQIRRGNGEQGVGAA